MSGSIGIISMNYQLSLFLFCSVIFKVIFSLFCLFCFILLQSRNISGDRNISPVIFFWPVIFSQLGVPILGVSRRKKG